MAASRSAWSLPIILSMFQTSDFKVILCEEQQATIWCTQHCTQQLGKYNRLQITHNYAYLQKAKCMIYKISIKNENCRYFVLFRVGRHVHGRCLFASDLVRLNQRTCCLLSTYYKYLKNTNNSLISKLDCWQSFAKSA